MGDVAGAKVAKKSQFYVPLSGGAVRCTLCERRCLVNPGGRGFCKARINLDGALYTLTYGNVSALESRPIEIKPFFHYWPGSTAMTFSTWSCNFACPWCQNYHLSRRVPEPGDSYTPPERVVEAAFAAGDEGLCVSFQEPTLMAEYAIDVFKLGSRRGLYCCYVSNGYMTREALDALIKAGLTGLKVDIKGAPETYERYCGGLDVMKVWENVRYALSRGVHVEIVNLIVTSVNEDEVEWVIENHLKFAGPDVPIHFTRYFPAYKFAAPPTKIATLEAAVKAARKAGIRYAYMGNVHGHPYENTYCPECGEQVITRYGYAVVDFKLKEDGRCPRCGFEIKVTGKYVREKVRWV